MCTSRPFSYFWQTRSCTQSEREREAEREGRGFQALPVSSIIHFEPHRNHRKITHRRRREGGRTIFSLIKFVKNWLELTCLLPTPVVDRLPIAMHVHMEVNRIGGRHSAACECVLGEYRFRWLRVACIKISNIICAFSIKSCFFIFMSLNLWLSLSVCYFDFLSSPRAAVKLPFMCFFCFFLGWRLVNSKRWFCVVVE